MVQRARLHSDIGRGCLGNGSLSDLHGHCALILTGPGPSSEVPSVVHLPCLFVRPEGSTQTRYDIIERIQGRRSEPPSLGNFHCGQRWAYADVVQRARLHSDTGRGRLGDRPLSDLHGHCALIPTGPGPSSEVPSAVHLPCLFVRPEGSTQTRDRILERVQGRH